jgi:regulation of enolase protein 1 (concanavalin A-like superfamily)
MSLPKPEALKPPRAGADVWGAGGQHDDAYATVYQSQAAGAGTSVTVRIDRQDNTNPWAKAGVMLRNNLTGAGSSAGYAIMALTPTNGVTFQWDSNSDGYLDQFATAASGTTAPVWVRLTRTGGQVAGYYSTNGTTFTQVGSTVNLSSPATTEDAGVFMTAHSTTAGTALFSNLRITSTPYVGYSNISADLDQHQGLFTITGAGADVWGAGGQHDDQYGAIYQASAASTTSTTTVHVDSQDNTNPWAKAGIMLRNSIAGSGSSAGYAVLAVTPSNGVSLEWDSNSDGYLDQGITVATSTKAPIWLKLTRNGTSVTGYYSSDANSWNTVGSATLSGSAGTEDAGMFATAHSTTNTGNSTLSQFSIVG